LSLHPVDLARLPSCGEVEQIYKINLSALGKCLLHLQGTDLCISIYRKRKRDTLPWHGMLKGSSKTSDSPQQTQTSTMSTGSMQHGSSNVHTRRYRKATGQKTTNPHYDTKEKEASMDSTTD